MNVFLRYLLAATLTTGTGLVLAPAAHAQRTDSTSTVKPQLNTAPPGTAPRPSTPAPRSRDQSVPVPAPEPAYEPVPAPRPTPDKPSGMDLPQQTAPTYQAPVRKYFLYSNFGLGYASNDFQGGQFSVSLGPAIGYRVTDKLALGPGISYAYNNISFSRDAQAVFGLPKSLNLHSVGVKAFLQYMAFKEFFVHAEYEVTKAQSYDLYDVGNRQLEVRKVNRTIGTPLAGVGYRNRISDRAAADIVILYNFNEGINDIYGQPVIRFNFLIDLK